MAKTTYVPRRVSFAASREISHHAFGIDRKFRPFFLLSHFRIALFVCCYCTITFVKKSFDSSHLHAAMTSEVCWGHMTVLPLLCHKKSVVHADQVAAWFTRPFWHRYSEMSPRATCNAIYHRLCGCWVTGVPPTLLVYAGLLAVQVCYFLYHRLIY